jgi:Taurine catabolism dioxygenase TauD, TfdA family
VTWPPRFHLPSSASAVLATAPARWSLTNLVDERCQKRALDQLYGEVSALRAALTGAAGALCREDAVVVEAVPTADPALVIAASAMGIVSIEDNGRPARLVWDVCQGPVSSAISYQTDYPPPATRSATSAGPAPRAPALPDALPLHTDSVHLERPHAVVGLACVKPSREGGISLLAPADRVVASLRADGQEHHIQLLQHPCFPFASISEDGRPLNFRPILSFVDNRAEVRYSEPLRRWGLKLATGLIGAEYHNALDVLGAVLRRPWLPTRLLLRANDFLVFNNRRIVHGRTEINPGDSRHLKRLKLHNPNFR